MSPVATRESVESVVTDALERFGVERADITMDAALAELDIDSLDMIELGQIVREEFGVELRPEDVTELRDVGDLVGMVVQQAG